MCPRLFSLEKEVGEILGDSHSKGRACTGQYIVRLTEPHFFSLWDPLLRRGSHFGISIAQAKWCNYNLSNGIISPSFSFSFFLHNTRTCSWTTENPFESRRTVAGIKKKLHWRVELFKNHVIKESFYWKAKIWIALGDLLNKAHGDMWTSTDVKIQRRVCDSRFGFLRIMISWREMIKYSKRHEETKEQI